MTKQKGETDMTKETNTANVTKTLSCELTKDEVREKGEALAELLGQIEVEEERKKAASDGHKATIETLELKAQVLGHAVRAKREDRQVECRIEHDYTARSVRTIRLDTFETINERTMTMDELQTDIPKIGKSAKSPA